MIFSTDKYDIDEAVAFTKNILPSVSRTFDLAIKFLPSRLGQPVGLAYLLCRIADTFEDSAILSGDQRRDFLIQYAGLMDARENYDESIVRRLKYAFPSTALKADISRPVDNHSSILLVQNIDQVLTAVDGSAGDLKKYIFPRVREMALGMADYTILVRDSTDRQTGDAQVNILKDEEDWDRYCYYVAGTVGHMLTDIFSDYVGFSEPTRNQLHDLGRSFGLGLQKVNVLKDAVVDTGRGICFLPKTLLEKYSISFDRKSHACISGDISGLVGTVIEACRKHFQDALDYIKVIPHKYLGLRMFLIVPVMLAASTLRLFSEYPQRLLERGDLKLARKDVWSIVRKSAFCKYSNRLLLSSFNHIYPA